MDEKKCLCGLPLEGNACQCQPEVCFRCCSCDETCQCGCKQKAESEEEKEK